MSAASQLATFVAIIDKGCVSTPYTYSMRGVPRTEENLPAVRRLAKAVAEVRWDHAWNYRREDLAAAEADMAATGRPAAYAAAEALTT